MEDYDETACEAIEQNLRQPATLREPTPSNDANHGGGSGDGSSWLSLGAMDVLWHYSGHGVIPQGADATHMPFPFQSNQLKSSCKFGKAA